MSDRDKKWLEYALLVIVILAAGYFGVKYPIPPMPEGLEGRVQMLETHLGIGDIGLQAVGPTRFRSIYVDHTATADDVTVNDDLSVIDDASVGGDITVTGTASWGCSTATITESLNLSGTLTAQDLFITNTTTLSGTVFVSDTVTFSGTTHLSGTVLVTGTLSAASSIDANAGMTIDGGVTNIGGGTPGIAAGDNDLYVTGDFEVASTSILSGPVILSDTTWFSGTAVFSNTVLLSNTLTSKADLEHMFFPTIVISDVAYTGATGAGGAIATIADGEIWFVWGVFVNVTTDFDCTGDDATLIVGDGADTDGFVVLADAELQIADTEQTGSPAGWQGLVAATMGVYIDGAVSSAPHIYAPSGAAETIDFLISEGSGDTLTDGEATIYVIYTRIQ